MVQVYERGLRLLDGAKMTQDLSIVSAKLEGNVGQSDNLQVVGASIADPYVVLLITDGTVQLVVGGTIPHNLYKSSYLDEKPEL